jgi:hypothetical protein
MKGQSGHVPTVYFRRSFELTAAQLKSITSGTAALVLRALVDDGASVLINGGIVMQHNIPPLNIQREARERAGDGDQPGDQQTLWYGLRAINTGVATDKCEYRATTTIPASALVVGTNAIAVEVHDAEAVHADLRFDMLLAIVSLDDIAAEAAAALPPSQLAPCQSPVPLPAHAIVRITRGPYLQMQSTTRMTIRWRSTAVHGGWVAFSVVSIDGGSPDRWRVATDSRCAGLDHVVHIAGLCAHCRVQYRVIDPVALQREAPLQAAMIAAVTSHQLVMLPETMFATPTFEFQTAPDQMAMSSPGTERRAT